MMGVIEQGSRFATVLVMISVFLIGVALVWTMQSKAAQKQAEYSTCMDAETREQLRIVMRAGIENAVRTHTTQMFNIWMKDPTNQPDRAITGMRNAVRAYVGSLKVINEWSPPSC